MNHKTPRILIVDDEHNLLTTIGDILKIKGFEPVCVLTGNEALVQVKAQSIDAALIDLRLGDMTGMEVLRGIKSCSPETECILLTGHASQNLAIEAIQVGAFGFFQKPVDMDQVLLSVQRAVEKRQGAQALRESERFARSTVDALSSHLAILDETGSILAVNRAWRDFAESNSTETSRTNLFEGSNYFSACIPAIGGNTNDAKDAEAMINGIRAVISGKIKEFSLEYPCHSPNEKRWFNAHVTRFSGEGALRIVVAHENITERKLAEEALLESEASLKRSQAVSHVGNWSWDTQTNQLTWSDEMYRIFGIDPRDFNGNLDTVIARAIHPDDREKVNRANATVINEKKPAPLEYRVIWPDQSVHTVRAQPSDNLTDENGNILHLKGIVQDITTAKEAEKELKEAHALLEQRVKERTAEVQDLYDNAPCGYHSLDTNGIFVKVNQTELDWLGYKHEELVGVKTFRDLLTPQSQQAFDKNFPRFKSQGWIKDLEYEMVRKDGSIIPVLLNATAIYSDHKIFLTSRSAILDNTERKLAEIALHESRDQLSTANVALEKAAHLKDEFLASMSHELRTPLTGILGFSEALQLKTYGELNEKQASILKTIEESGRHLLDLINDILDLSKIEAGKLELQFVPCSLSDICLSSLKLTKGMAQQKFQQVHYSLADQTLIIRADARRLKQILVNLLSNAIKFTPANGEVGLDVQAIEAERVIKITVWDKGIGIKPEDMQKLFKPFSQIDSSLAREYSGTGLGLSLAQRLIEMHNGGIEVESVFGEGSRFTIALPWSPHNTTPIPYSSHHNFIKTGPLRLAKSANTYSILIADDNEMVLSMVADYLESNQYHVVKVRSGTELLEQITGLRPDVILMDIQMPGMNGIEAIRRIRSHGDQVIASTPIIAVTALAMPGDREKCLLAGANEYMSKPLKLKELSRFIKDQVEKRQ